MESRWSQMPDGRRPSKESLIPAVLLLIRKYEKTMRDGMSYSALDESPLGLGKKLPEKLEKMPTDLLYLFHEVLVNMDEHIENLGGI